ncbi:hypothetical protein [Spirosoma pomorum]|jgi:hypothetical protein
MKHVYWLILGLVFGWHVDSFAQIGDTDEDWRVISVANHQKGQWLVGGGGSVVGLTAKAGKFVANRTWIGLSGEATVFSEARLELGAFARYYLWEGGFLSGFAEAGVSYGQFREILDSDDVGPARHLYSPKLTAGFGIELPIYRRVSLEGVSRLGQLTAANWVQPSFQGSINFYFTR